MSMGGRRIRHHAGMCRDQTLTRLYAAEVVLESKTSAGWFPADRECRNTSTKERKNDHGGGPMRARTRRDTAHVAPIQPGLQLHWSGPSGEDSSMDSVPSLLQARATAPTKE